MVILSTQFFCLFSAFSSVQNSVAMLFEQQQQSNLGIYSLLTLYLVFGVGALLAPNISLIFRASHVSNHMWYQLMCISALGFSGYIASGLLVAHCSGGSKDGICSEGSVYAIVIIAAMICGFGAATIWVYIIRDLRSHKLGTYRGSVHRPIGGSLMVYFLLGCNHHKSWPMWCQPYCWIRGPWPTF